MKQHLIFPMSAPYRIYSPGWGYNLLLMLVFLGGVGTLAFVLIPLVTKETLTAEAYLYGGAGFLVLGVFMALMFSMFSQVSAWQERRTIRNITQGKDLLAVWQYTVDEWHRLADMQTNSERHLGHKWWHHLVSAIMAGGVVGYMIFAGPPEVQGIYFLIGAFVIGMILLTAAGNNLWQRIVFEQNRQRRMEKSAPTLYVSRKGLYHETEGMLRFGELQEVALHSEGDIPELVFSARFYGPSRFATSWLASVSIPIPRRHLADAQRLVAQFKHL